MVDDYVTDDSGTGIVHNAPAFGEDDYRVCLAHGIIQRGKVPCPLSAPCSMLSALCSLLFVFCSLLSALCSLLFVLCPLPSALCSLPFSLCPLSSAHPNLPMHQGIMCPVDDNGRFTEEVTDFVGT
jgi:hypothetical protein